VCQTVLVQRDLEFEAESLIYLKLELGWVFELDLVFPFSFSLSIGGSSFSGRLQFFASFFVDFSVFSFEPIGWRAGCSPA